MKVVLLKSRLFFKGGLEKYTLKLASHFAKKGCDVTILTTTDEEKSDHNEFKIIRLGKSSKFTLFHLYKFNRLCSRWLKQHPSDVVFGMERTTSQNFYRAGSGVHAAYLKQKFAYSSFLKRCSLLFNPLHSFLLYLEKQCFQNPHLKILFVNSAMVKEEILQYYKVEPSRIEIVHNGVNWKDLEKPFKESFPKKKGFSFLFVGNDYRRKGLNLLFPALSQLKLKEYHLHVVGRDKNIDYFKRVSASYGLENNITFHGPQENLIPFYQKSDVLLLPTIYDPFANVTLEALSFGLFVVTSKFNGASEIISVENGVIIDDLKNNDSIKSALELSLLHPKSELSATTIRNSIKELEFSSQLDKIVTKTLE